jgi:hypothetical protein
MPLPNNETEFSASQEVCQSKWNVDHAERRKVEPIEQDNIIEDHSGKYEIMRGYRLG